MPLTRSEIMSRIRSESRWERGIRLLLWGKGVKGYRKHHGKYKIDIAFPKKKIAVFLDSCFWHGCPKHFRLPKTNVTFWSSKIEANRCRDSNVNTHLRRQGWTVLRFWEHKPTEAIMEKIITILNSVPSEPPSDSAR